MTLEEIENSLPNGFHDAQIQNINVDYLNRIIAIKLNLWTGDISSEFSEIREEMSSAELFISDFVYFVIEPPQNNYPFLENKRLDIGAGPLNGYDIPSAKNLPQEVPNDAFTYWFFVKNWNSFIFICGMDGKLQFN